MRRRPLFSFVLGALALSAGLAAETITTAAGGGPDNLPALSANLSFPQGVAVDGAGNLYIPAASQNRVFKVAPSGTLTVLAGTGLGGYGGDGGPARDATLNGPHAVAVDAAGNVFIADRSNNRVRRVDAASGTITTVAGNGTFGFNGDNIHATTARLGSPFSVAVDGNGNLYIAEAFTNRVRRVDAATGFIRTVAVAFSFGIAVDGAGNLFIGDVSAHRVFRVDRSTGAVTTVAGNGVRATTGDGGPATAAAVESPYSVAVDGNGNLYIAQSHTGVMQAGRVRKVSGGIITTVPHGAPEAWGIAVDPGGTLYVATGNAGRIQRVDSTGVITTVAGNGRFGFSGDGFPATSAVLGFTTGVALDAAGSLHISTQGFDQRRIRKVDSETGVISTVTDALCEPSAVTFDTAGHLIVAERNCRRVRRVDPATGIVTNVAGTGGFGPPGDGGLATSANLSPEDVAVSPWGDLYVADIGGAVRRVEAGTGIITTVAAGGTPASVALDRHGSLFIGFRLGRVVRVDTGPDGVVTGAPDEVQTTVAGTGSFVSSGDGGPATAAGVGLVARLAFDTAGNLFISEEQGFRVRRVDAGADGRITGAPDEVITTVAGTGIRGFSGDGGPATTATLSQFSGGLALDRLGNLYIADSANLRVRRVEGAAPPAPETDPPVIRCDAPDGVWHAADASLSCTAHDDDYGLADPADAAFSLSTYVRAGSEVEDASTGVRVVCDTTGSCAAAGPIRGNKVDKKAPQVVIRTPHLGVGDFVTGADVAGSIYLLNQAVSADYACSDGGSGLATCTGTVPSGNHLDTTSVGLKALSVDATDNVGNASTRTASYKVTYAVTLLFDRMTAKKSGSVFSLRLQLADANGTNYSGQAAVVTATRIVRVSDHAPAELDDAGNANPDFNFRFDPALGGGGGYVFNLSTQGFSTGTYRLFFTVSDDPIEHSLDFQVK